MEQTGHCYKCLSNSHFTTGKEEVISVMLTPSQWYNSEETHRRKGLRSSLFAVDAFIGKSLRKTVVNAGRNCDDH